MINIGIIGYGYWGPNLVRNFYVANNCCVKSVADTQPGRLRQLQQLFPCINACISANEILNDPDIDAVVIATPVFTHFRLAKKAFNKGKHVLLEKPLTTSSKEAEILIDMAIQKNLLLMVDHTFLYTGAIEKMKQLTEEDELGTIKYLDSTRINLGLFQPDINVLWDLAPHDLSILRYLVTERPYSVNATGITHTRNGIENIAYLTVNYQSGFIAHFNCSWTSPVKVRMMLLGGDKKMILYNDLEPSEKIKVYDTGYSHKTGEEKRRILVDYRTGDIHVPKLRTGEALLAMANDFIESIISSKQPRSSWMVGLEVVKILEASDKSIRNNGKEIFIDAPRRSTKKMISENSIQE
ncbi:Gfo/Idh/MocA family oxidoreductase [Danxiaibacter flavus]|uniref:Gfo/Idh/MocA family oxidoreductase n=1 Tax=Danxiaibacter flavus TaxID=3049108 RepID=A0ABV3ZJ66_9BACT|nr:Gfo/Idh/MocA family oxidoreductase [Chitinophagaceae bacterium DXS]